MNSSIVVISIETQRKPVESSPRILVFPHPGNMPSPEPPPSAPNPGGTRPATRVLEFRAGMVIRQVIATRDVRRVARNHGVTVRDVVGLLVDRIQLLERNAA